MKYSKQRDLIYQTVCQYPIHPTADDVYQLVKKEMPQIGIATVYRNLGTLSQLHVLRRYRSEDGVDRFDANMHEHPHFHCTECHKMFDYPSDNYEEIKASIMGKSSFHEKSIEITVKGICDRCFVSVQNADK